MLLTQLYGETFIAVFIYNHPLGSQEVLTMFENLFNLAIFCTVI